MPEDLEEAGVALQQGVMTLGVDACLRQATLEAVERVVRRGLEHHVGRGLAAGEQQRERREQQHGTQLGHWASSVGVSS